MKYLFIAKSSLAVSILLGTVLVHAETLSCKLYINTPIDLTHTIKRPSVKVKSVLEAQRYIGTCHFEDGSVASQQFIGVQRTIGDSNTGTVLGYSTYSFNEKDSITLSFDGSWNNGDFNGNGNYIVVAGSGSYEHAKGNGSLKSAENPLPDISVFDVVINLAESLPVDG